MWPYLHFYPMPSAFAINYRKLVIAGACRKHFQWPAFLNHGMLIYLGRREELLFKKSTEPKRWTPECSPLQIASGLQPFFGGITIKYEPSKPSPLLQPTFHPCHPPTYTIFFFSFVFTTIQK